MNNEIQEVASADILEFLKEHMVMKEDFDTRLNGIDTRLDKVDVRLESLDSRFFEFQTELDDIKIKLSAIETRLKEDTDALNNVLITEVAGLKKRVAFLEQKLGLQGFDFNGISV